MIVAPFPYFGGKRYAAPLVWDALGDVRHYIEPFAGSIAVLLAAEKDPRRTETVNDIDGYITNVWRAIQHDPEAVAHYASWPVNELDLTARHLWLVNDGKPDTVRLETDPEYFDAKAAGWWIWGKSTWIGRGWCAGDGPWTIGRILGRPEGEDHAGVCRQLPELGRASGSGVHRRADNRKQFILDWMLSLGDRLERVRVCHGDWRRVLSDSVALGPAGRGRVGVFLDPPYKRSNASDPRIYSSGYPDIADDVAQWAFERGDDPRYRIVLAGWDGDVSLPDGWRSVSWNRVGGNGYANQSGRKTQERERLWLSPHCVDTGAEIGQLEIPA